MNIKDTTLADLQKVKEAADSLQKVDIDVINAVLVDCADALVEGTEDILAENKKDLSRMDSSDPLYDRLLLTEDRIRGIADDMKTVSELESPLNKVLEEKQRPNGLKIKKVSLPLGVVGMIYEARPNVTADVFSLCFKSGNASVLKGGSAADCSNRAIVSVIQKVLTKNNLNPNIIYLLSNDREAVSTMMKAHGLVDVIIPRGSAELIEYVRNTAQIPVIETGRGVCHIYVDSGADVSMAAGIIDNAKTRRPSVCNALDTLIIHKDQISNLQKLVGDLEKKNVEIRADEHSYAELTKFYNKSLLKKAVEEDFGAEYMDLILSIKIVDSLDVALSYLRVNSSRHSEGIVANDKKSIDRFEREVDAACIFVNSSIAFADGAQFGLGAEIGISTQKLHARGPMGLEALTSYKWIVEGTGQIRGG